MVRLNPLGLQRINAARAAKGLPPVATDTMDIEKEVTGTTTRVDRAKIRQSFRIEATTTASTTKEIPGIKKNDLKTEIEARKQELANRRASTTAEIKATKVTAAVKTAQSHLDQEIQRLGEIKTKIDSRLSKLDQAGATTTAARADLALSVTALQTAQTKADAIAIVDVSTSNAADAIRQAVQDAQNAINDAQKSLTQVVADMKLTNNE